MVHIPTGNALFGTVNATLVDPSGNNVAEYTKSVEANTELNSVVMGSNVFYRLVQTLSASFDIVTYVEAVKL